MDVKKYVQTELILMRVLKTSNDFEINENMILNSLHTFPSKPIVYNADLSYKDYTDKARNKEFNNKNCIGIIDAVHYDQSNKHVVGNVTILKEFAQRKELDNWQITFNPDHPDSFIFNACELSHK